MTTPKQCIKMTMPEAGNTNSATSNSSMQTSRQDLDLHRPGRQWEEKDSVKLLLISEIDQPNSATSMIWMKMVASSSLDLQEGAKSGKTLTEHLK